jgi:hypothetical protein
MGDVAASDQEEECSRGEEQDDGLPFVAVMPLMHGLDLER